MKNLRNFLLLLFCLMPVQGVYGKDNSEAMSYDEGTSILEACIQGTFKKTANGDLEFPDYQNPRKTYKRSPSFVCEVFTEVNNLMTHLRLGWQPLAFELSWDEQTWNGGNPHVTRVNDDDVSQLQLIRWYDEWRGGRDLTEPITIRFKKRYENKQLPPDNELEKMAEKELAPAQKVIKARFTLLTAIKNKDAGAIDASCKQLSKMPCPQKLNMLLSSSSNKLTGSINRLVYLKRDIASIEPEN